jgi:hypothetical protein
MVWRIVTITISIICTGLVLWTLWTVLFKTTPLDKFFKARQTLWDAYHAKRMMRATAIEGEWYEPKEIGE